MRFLALVLFLATVLFVLGARFYYVCDMKDLCVVEDPIDILPPSERARTLSLRIGDSTILSGYEEFAFDSASVYPLLSSDNVAFIDTVATIFEADTLARLTIVGFYRPSEQATADGFFENLGLARADAIRNLLTARGLAQDRISLDHGIAASEALGEPIMFDAYYPVSSNEGDYERLAFTFTNMTFSDANFAFNSAVFEPGGAFLAYADSVRTYLQLNPEQELTIIGHTDNVGDNSYNQGLGLDRAKSARTYFQERGVTNTIEVDSRGETEPAATNQTAQGRQKNRRVNFVLE